MRKALLSSPFAKKWKVSKLNLARIKELIHGGDGTVIQTCSAPEGVLSPASLTSIASLKSQIQRQQYRTLRKAGGDLFAVDLRKSHRVSWRRALRPDGLSSIFNICNAEKPQHVLC